MSSDQQTSTPTTIARPGRTQPRPVALVLTDLVHAHCDATLPVPDRALARSDARRIVRHVADQEFNYYWDIMVHAHTCEQIAETAEDPLELDTTITAGLDPNDFDDHLCPDDNIEDWREAVCEQWRAEVFGNAYTLFSRNLIAHRDSTDRAHAPISPTGA